MATTTAGAFAEFVEKLKPTESQWETIHARRTSNQAKLAEAFPASESLRFDCSSLIGSADRGTIIGPPDDVDVIAVFDPAGFAQYRADSQTFIERVRDALDVTAPIVGTWGQAVRLLYPSGPITDITPGFARKGGGFLIPRAHGGWQAIDPELHNTHVSDKHAELGFHLKPLARLVKAWSREHGQPLSSFHLECMLAATFTSLGENYRDASWQFFESAPITLHVDDPAGHSGDLAAKFSLAQAQDVRRSFASARDKARSALNAEAAEDHEDAMRLWRTIFGQGFPGFG